MCINSDKKLRSNESQAMKNEKHAVQNIRDFLENYNFSKSDEGDGVSDNDGKDVINEDYFNDEAIAVNTYTCEICSSSFDMFLEYLDHQEEHNGQPVFNCDKCKEVFNFRLELVEHENKHKKSCPKCGKMVLKTSMRLHLLQHTDRYMCTTCSHRFSSKTTLKEHIITVHTDIKNHVCGSCGKRFSTKTGINIHMKTHKEEREYNCKLCNYAGRTSSAIYIHMATHANEIHCCEMCPKTFKSARNLTDHLRRTHSKVKRHQCTFCDMRFVDKYMLLVHVRTHTGDRPYKCDLCEKAFIRSDSLKEHKATHGSRTFFNCERCSKKFTSKKGFARHTCVMSVTR